MLTCNAKFLAKFANLKMKLFLASIFYFLTIVQVNSQCIAVYPYHEDFELNNGGWISGGTANDWAWGSPAKAVISNAGNGAKCWISGGLAGNFYNLNERAYVVSPCFDFSLLAHPYVRFKTYWETENHFDGAGFQYSINNGATWVNVGSANPANNCYTANWFNYNNINHLSTLATPKIGWSGNSLATVGTCQGGSGSFGWVLAKHCITNLAGQPSVLFRFVFGAGSACNNFNGFAFDDFYIEECPPITANYNYTCIGNGNFSFSDSSLNCPETWAWNFDDPTSASNSSALQNPSHTFANAGTYNVQLIINNSCAGADTIIKTIYVLGLTATAQNTTCNQLANGSATATLIGNNGLATFQWNSTPMQFTSTATNLPAGTYTVIANQINTCSASYSVTINSPSSLVVNSITTNSICTASNGTATISCSGASPSYTYTWVPNVSTSNTATNLAAGNYIVYITDANNCIDSTLINIDTTNNSLTISNITTPAICTANNGTATLNVIGGTAAYTYNWLPNVSTTSIATGLAPANYKIIVSDINGCVDSQTIVITNSPGNVLLLVTPTNITCNGSNNGSINSIISGAANPISYLWLPNFGSTSNLNNLDTGMYQLIITDANGCKDTATSAITEPALLQTNYTSTNATCNSSNGSISLNSTGGNSPYSYLGIGNAINSSITNNLLSATYIVQTTDGNNCKVLDTIIITSSIDIQANAQIIADTCSKNKGKAMIAILQGTAPYNYSWVGLSNNTANASGLSGNNNYQVIITDGKGCKDTLTLAIPVLGLFNINLGLNTTICEGEIMEFNLPGYNNYLWSDGSTLPNFKVSKAGDYFVSVQNNFGCSASDTINITPYCVDVVQFPNAFSPNNDDVDDIFLALTNSPLALINFSLKIYNRWGQLVFSSASALQGWDGKFQSISQPIGTYIYIATYLFKGSSQVVTIKNNLTLIR
jgi:gliding motility-associated-like protein